MVQVLGFRFEGLHNLVWDYRLKPNGVGQFIEGVRFLEHFLSFNHRAEAGLGEVRFNVCGVRIFNVSGGQTAGVYAGYSIRFDSIQFNFTWARPDHSTRRALCVRRLRARRLSPPGGHCLSGWALCHKRVQCIYLRNLWHGPQGHCLEAGAGSLISVQSMWP